jgi:hypothetical protein
VVAVDSKRAMVRPIERPDRLMTRAKDILFWSFGGFRVRGKSDFERPQIAKLFGGRRRREWRDGGAAEGAVADGGRVGSCWVRRKNDIAQRWTGWGRRSRKIGKLGRFRKALAIARFLGRTAANQRA